MKIMEVSSDDECQIEEVIDTTSKEVSKQERLPFKTLSSDTSVPNKKRKQVVSPCVRKPKIAKVNTKENSPKTSNKTEKEEIIIVEDEGDVKDDKKDKKVEEAKNVTISSKQTDSKKKKSIGGKTPKAKKSESKIQLTPVTKFFKKIDDKDKVGKNEVQTEASNSEESTKESVQCSQIIDVSDNSNDHCGQQEKESSKNLGKKDDDIKLKNKENEPSDQDSFSSDEDEQESVEPSSVKDDENMDADSDVCLDVDSSSDTDKRTEHEDTDSKDDVNRNSAKKSKSSSKLSDLSITKKLTPKQIEKKRESMKKREMREKQRFEREKKLQEERENRKKEKEEKKREREEKDKALKEQKKKEKEEREQKKLAELEQKQKEKEAKEEDRRKREEAKEEERKRKEEEKLEAERKKQKAASNFVSFFVSKKPTETKPAEVETKVVQSNFMPFEVKVDMRTAPVTRRKLSNGEKSELDKLMSESIKNVSELYINELRSKKFCVRKSGKTWPVEANDDVVIIEGEEETSANVVQASQKAANKHRAKLFLFNENRRPPYWGTWRKKSKLIRPRRPFVIDTKWFDYEVDSDDEWEEEEPGESLRGSDDEKEEDPEDNEYDVDNDFMVPHGYLSEEEIMADEEEGEEDDDLNPERQKTKLKILNEQFEAERKQKTTKLNPKVIGCCWLQADNTYPENTPDSVVRFLTVRQAWARAIPLSLTAPAEGDLSENTAWSAKHAATSARNAETLEEAVPDLIRLVHGNTNAQKFLMKEFLEFWYKVKEDKRPLTKMKLKEKIRELATYTPCPEPGPLHEKSMWYVPEEVRKKYLGDETLSLPNCWTYCLTPKKKVKQPQSEVKEKQPLEKSEDVKEKKNTPRITQFTKTLTAEEMQKQLTEKPATVSTAKTTTPPMTKLPKRVALVSLPRLEYPLKSPRVSLINKFVTSSSSAAGDKKVVQTPNEDSDDGDDVRIIDDNDDVNVDTSIKSECKEISKSASTDSPQLKGDANDTAPSDKTNEKSDNTSCSDVEIMENFFFFFFFFFFFL
ncbi:chromatin assembly factor 1 subunit A [Copidosoma floridanum]|uniref:chromatin assembly factor 1 subunit A n=1 Tax=Copidosoma floridanum TaxID=29053 RepID=UPI0006C95A6C|nr:chromatin assembly factor 1 subunit A [Copidosoma floridanum]